MTTRRQEATAIVDQENYYMYVLMLTSGNVSKVAVRNHPLAYTVYIIFHTVTSCLALCFRLQVFLPRANGEGGAEAGRANFVRLRRAVSLAFVTCSIFLRLQESDQGACWAFGLVLHYSNVDTLGPRIFGRYL